MIGVFALRCLDRPRDHAGRKPRVTIDEQDPLAAGLPGPDMQRVALAKPSVGQGLDVYDADVRSEVAQAVEDCTRAVRRSIVDEDYLQVDVLLLPEAVGGDLHRC